MITTCLFSLLQAQEDAKNGYVVRAKKKALITYFIMVAAIVIDVIVIVVAVTFTVF